MGVVFLFQIKRRRGVNSRHPLPIRLGSHAWRSIASVYLDCAACARPWSGTEQPGGWRRGIGNTMPEGLTSESRGRGTLARCVRSPPRRCDGRNVRQPHTLVPGSTHIVGWLGVWRCATRATLGCSSAGHTTYCAPSPVSKRFFCLASNVSGVRC